MKNKSEWVFLRRRENAGRVTKRKAELIANRDRGDALFDCRATGRGHILISVGEANKRNDQNPPRESYCLWPIQ